MINIEIRTIYCSINYDLISNLSFLPVMFIIFAKRFIHINIMLQFIMFVLGLYK